MSEFFVLEMFQTTVITIRKRPDFSATGQWDVVTETNGKQTSEIFDAVMVCIGYLADPSLQLSSFPGIVVLDFPSI